MRSVKTNVSGLFASLCVPFLVSTVCGAEVVDFRSHEQIYLNEVRPIVVRVCQNCHSEKVMEAEIDLSIYSSISEIRKHPDVWQKVGEMLESGQMPPKDEPQPTDAERQKLGQWVRSYLKDEAKSRAGDPGRVVLRRLNNVEYTNTIRDLTGVKSLQPAREFPVDSAAGEGFTNLGNALVISPALITKYLDAGKDVANHAVLVPSGIRFSPAVTARDWTEELLADIRSLYAKYTDERGATQINVQGIVFDTNGGGRLPLERYLETLLTERDAISQGKKTFDAIGAERSLSPKYLNLVWTAMTSSEPSLLLDPIKVMWKTAKPSDATAIANLINRWQPSLWRFTSIGHIGKLNGPKAWMEPLNPIQTRTEVRMKIPAMSDGQTAVAYLTATDAGDGNENDFAVWENPRLVAPGRADLPLRDVRAYIQLLQERREQTFATAAQALQAAAEASVDPSNANLEALASKYKVNPEILSAWFSYLRIATGGSVKLDNLFTQKIPRALGYDFVKGWGDPSTPMLFANSSDQHVRIPGNMKPHGVTVHPAPTLQTAVGWRSPVKAIVKIDAKIQHAHPECGNGVTWSLELRRGTTRQRLANGVAHGANVVTAKPIENLSIQVGDVVSLLIGPRNRDHGCDLTAIDLTVTSTADSKVWDLAADISPDIHAGNPHADKFGNEGVWSFYTEPSSETDDIPGFPRGSILAKWQDSTNADEKRAIAAEIQKLLKGEIAVAKESPDAELIGQLRSLGGPLFRLVRPQPQASVQTEGSQSASAWGVDPKLFGRHPNGQPIDGNSLCVKAPAVIEVPMPADLVSGWEIVASGYLHRETGKEGTVQMQIVSEKPSISSSLVPGAVTETSANSRWTDNNRMTSYSAPILVTEGSSAIRRVEASLDAFRSLFPAALCYAKIVPVDEVVTLTLFYREDQYLKRLMLSDEEGARLDRLWSELHFVSRDALTLVDGFNQLMEFATQDADPKVFEPLRKPIYERAAAFKQELLDAEPKQLASVLEFASQAYRRPLKTEEAQGLQSLYRSLRDQELPHDEAIRFLIARVLVAPAFLYRVEPIATATVPSTTNSSQGLSTVPVNDFALASRLSYFLWSTMPDNELRSLAASNKLSNPDVLIAQAKRLMKSDRIRALSTEFACQWLGVRDFDSHSEKSEQVFPTFTGLRGDMYEESIQFFADLFQRDGSVLEILDADHTFLNETLAKHYGIPNVTGPEWRRVDNVKQYGRGGILTLATTLAQQSGASRTSPILRGNWVLESLLGEKLPKPPKNVPPLPESEADADLTVRQLVELHRSVDKCATCHARIDAFGFSLEGYDAIGRRRDKDLAGRPIDVNVVLMDGTKFAGETGLKNYLLNERRSTFLHHFCRKLLGYSLARGVQLSDEPLLEEMISQLKTHDYRFSVAIETIVRSPQFRLQRTSFEE